MKKQNKKYQNAKSSGEKLKKKGVMFFVSCFLCDLQDFKFQYVNHKAFGAIFSTELTLRKKYHHDFVSKRFQLCSVVSALIPKLFVYSHPVLSYRLHALRL